MIQGPGTGFEEAWAGEAQAGNGAAAVAGGGVGRFEAAWGEPRAAEGLGQQEEVFASSTYGLSSMIDRFALSVPSNLFSSVLSASITTSN